jgi:hypothetical protein
MEFSAISGDIITESGCGGRRARWCSSCGRRIVVDVNASVDVDCDVRYADCV